jgi:hypothetical protein
MLENFIVKENLESNVIKTELMNFIAFMQPNLQYCFGFPKSI